MSRDHFFQGVIETGAQLLSAKGGSATLELELRFSNHEALLVFQDNCANNHINLEVGTIYNPTRPETGLWFGLSPSSGQRWYTQRVLLDPTDDLDAGSRG
ncbi:hypothetical protein RBH26_15095 [Natronolimnohabitans sp. A-GB9]|uniref:hypothetical protein n=1 Tax=Natronolimnohabitans sp. A-GB9 TaxID=3069757 RepID=UPI0027B5B749|nr:hypothetical protein [Natronolimnohabitans sp. A-GB9]MDQ2051803.1 hypothetical protein [Natronolimnohabitans sp. A-GB9]